MTTIEIHRPTATASRNVVERLLRWRPSAAFLAAFLIWFAGPFFGDTPDTRDTTAEVSTYFTDHRASILAGVVVFGAGLMALLVHVGDVADRLAGLGERRTARIATSAISVAISVITVSVLVVLAGLAYVIGEEAPAMAKGLFELTLVGWSVAAVPLALTIAAITIGLHRTGSGRRWFRRLGAVCTAVIAMAAVGWAYRGPLSPDVTQSLVMLSLIVWSAASGRGLRTTDAP